MTNKKSPLELVTERIAALGDWRGDMLRRVRALIKEADPEVIEEIKWRKPSNSMLGIPVWSHAGIICTGETYKNKVKLTFAKGPRFKIAGVYSMPAWMGMSDAPLIFIKMTR